MQAHDPLGHRPEHDDRLPSLRCRPPLTRTRATHTVPACVRRLPDLRAGATRPVSSLALALSALGDPEDPAAFSGMPASIIGALRTVVERTVAISASPPPRTAAVAWRAGALMTAGPSTYADRRTARARLWTLGQYSGPMHAASQRTTEARIRAAGRIDGLVQLGGELTAPPGIPMVTLQDSTLAQAVREYPWPHLEGLTNRAIERSLRWQRAAFGSAVACCAASHWVADSLHADYWIPRERIHVVGLGANHRPEHEIVERDWSTPRFLFAGGEWRRKNGERLLSAFAAVHEQLPAARLELVGGHPPTDQAGVTGHGRLNLGDRADRARMRELFASATVFVMPSLHEPLGVAYIDAAAAGVPSIGTISGGAATFIADTGRLVDPTETRSLVEAMLELSDGELARRLGERARERSALFTWEKVAERLVRALRLPDVDPSGLAEFL